MEKKKEQLGMNPSTASGKLLKDLLFGFVSKAGLVCYRCGLPMLRENFSVEHKIPWLDSEDPIGLFFNPENIAYSHLVCNIGAARRPNKMYKDVVERRAAGWSKYYDKNKDQILERKRQRYHLNKHQGVV